MDYISLRFPTFNFFLSSIIAFLTLNFIDCLKSFFTFVFAVSIDTFIFFESRQFKADVPTEPYNLPSPFEWSDIDIEDDTQLQEVYSLLKNNYVEDEGA